MTKKEFLSQLRQALSGEVPEEEIINQLNYYESYITNESKYGDEEKVVEDLGNPYLIARTIIDAYERAYGSNYQGGRDRHYGEKWDSDGYSSSSPNYNQDYEDRSDAYGQDSYNKSSNGIPWYKKLLIALLIIGIIALVVLLGSVFIRILLYLLPFILIISLIYIVVKYIDDHKQ